MKSPVLKGILGGTLLALGLSLFFQKQDHSGVFEFSSSPGPTGSEEQNITSLPTWALSGKLPDRSKKVYITIRNQKIFQISSTKPDPAIPLLETDHYIFPGLVDMHNHIKYNILPIWDLAQGQFTNRFEWRERFPPYKDAVSFNMRPIRGDTVCAAVRWAEIKALTGGATAFQGVGADSKCASDFGVKNIELPGEYDNKVRIRALTDLIYPDMLKNVYIPQIEPLAVKPLSSTESQENQNGSEAYDQALLNVLENSKILSWLEKFYNEPRSLGLAFELLIGDSLGLVDTEGDPEQLFSESQEALKKYLAEAHGMNEKAQVSQIEKMQLWIFGKNKNGYLYLPPASKKLSGLELITDSKTMDYFGKGGVISVDKKIRRYLAMYEVPIRRSILKYLQDKESLAVVAHLAEGMRKDPYNASEYHYAKKMGFVQPGLVMIHAVGLSKEDLKHAAENKVSIVWSPFSNLLLYGETLDVLAAHRAKVNLALGADWTPTGSKTILDELKIARRYLNKEKISKRVIGDRDLVNMVTINAARALNLDDRFGKVEVGYFADLVLINPKRLGKIRNPYSKLVWSTQEDVGLVIRSGQPIYGDTELLGQYTQITRLNLELETIPLDNKCNFQKALVTPKPNKYDESFEQKYPGQSLRTALGIHQELTQKMSEYADKVKTESPSDAKNLVSLDPLFNCEDARYSGILARFVEESLDKNRKNRSIQRENFRLDDSWSPLGVELMESDDPSEEVFE